MVWISRKTFVSEPPPPTIISSIPVALSNMLAPWTLPLRWHAPLAAQLPPMLHLANLIQSLGFGVWGLGLRSWGLEVTRRQGVGCRV